MPSSSLTLRIIFTHISVILRNSGCSRQMSLRILMTLFLTLIPVSCVKTNWIQGLQYELSRYYELCVELFSHLKANPVNVKKRHEKSNVCIKCQMVAVLHWILRWHCGEEVIYCNLSWTYALDMNFWTTSQGQSYTWHTVFFSKSP